MRMPMIAITTKSSTRVNPDEDFGAGTRWRLESQVQVGHGVTHWQGSCPLHEHWFCFGCERVAVALMAVFDM
jgi:hypothetical protein